jgi:hypothetical protein
MKTMLILVIVCGLMSPVYCQQSTSNATTTDVDNSFGILELFDGVPLYLNRVYNSALDNFDIRDYVPLEGHYVSDSPLIIKKSIDGNTLTIQKGSRYTIALHKTKIPGEFRVPNKFGYKSSKKRDISAKILADGSLQFSYTEKFPSRNVYKYDHYEILGFGVRISSRIMDSHLINKDIRITNYYETKEEHEKTDFQRSLRIISLGETAEALNSYFRFAARGGTYIKITIHNTRNKGNAYVTLYGVDGEVIKETEGKGTLDIFYRVPEDGFYYISTMKDDEDELLITLTEQ